MTMKMRKNQIWQRKRGKISLNILILFTTQSKIITYKSFYALTKIEHQPQKYKIKQNCNFTYMYNTKTTVSKNVSTKYIDNYIKLNDKFFHPSLPIC